MSGRAELFADHARRYSELGWALIRAEGKKPKGLGWEKTQPGEPGAVAGQWSVWGETLNVGVVCGTSGIAVIDVDVDVNPEGALLALLGTDTLPRTPIVRTGRGRLQAYFIDPGGLEKAVRDGIELRVGPHQCIAPPSVHPDTGRSYRWLIGHEPWNAPLAPLPSVVVEHFTALQHRNGTPASPIEEIIPIGSIDRTLASLAGTMRRRGMSEDAICAALVVELDRCEPGHTHTEKDCARIAKSIVKKPPANQAQGVTGRPDDIDLDQVRPAGDAVGTHPSAAPESDIDWLAGHGLKQVEWVERPLLQAAALTLLAGRPGIGKGGLVARWCARCTNGDMYGDARCVILLASEEDAEIDLGPRVEVAGGDRDLIALPPHSFRLPSDIDWLRDYAARVEAERGRRVGLIAIDPISNHTGKANTDSDSEVREALQPLASLVAEIRIPTIAVRHLSTKDAKTSALAKIIGSTAWVGVPRAVLIAVADAADPTLVHVHPAKGNRVARAEAGRRFRLEGRMLPGFTESVVCAVEDGVSLIDIDEQLNGDKAETPSAQARELILDILEAEGEQESDEFDARVARETRLAAKTIRNLRGALANDGLIKSMPASKDEHGVPVLWKVYRTAAQR